MTCETCGSKFDQPCSYAAHCRADVLSAIASCERRGARRPDLVVTCGLKAFEQLAGHDGIGHGDSMTLEGVRVEAVATMPSALWRVERAPFVIEPGSLQHALCVCPLCGKEASQLFSAGLKLTACECVARGEVAIAQEQKRLEHLTAPIVRGNFDHASFRGEREIYREPMDGLTERREHIVSVVETHGAKPQPTLNDADRRRRAAEAFRKAQGIGAVVESRKCEVCGFMTTAKTGCNHCRQLAEYEARNPDQPTYYTWPRDLPTVEEEKARQSQVFARFETLGREGERVEMSAEDRKDGSDIWSHRLRELQAEARRKERERVVLDMEWD